MWLTQPSTAGLQRQCFLMTQHQNHHFFGIQQGTNTDGQGIFWHQIHIVIKETRVRDASFMGQGFDTSTDAREDAGSLNAI